VNIGSAAAFAALSFARTRRGRRFLKDIEGLFVRMLELAREMGHAQAGHGGS